MKLAQIKKHIIRVLATMHLPGIKELKLRKIEATSETDAGMVVQATVISHVRIGHCKHQKVTQPVTFTLLESAGVISVQTTHDWLSAWESFWITERDSHLSAARAEVEKLLGPWDESDPTHFAAVLLSLSDSVGPYPTLLARLTGRPGSEIELIAARFRGPAIWVEDSVDSDRWRVPHGEFDFATDALVGAGHLERRWPLDDGADSCGPEHR
jgi:hypothetical protein